MRFVGNVAELQKGLDIICPNQTPDVEVQVNGQAEILTIWGKDGKYGIDYGVKTDFFRGVCILKDKLEKGERDFCVEQKRNFDTCGIMADVSRRAVLKLDTVKDILVHMAKMGLNMIMMYTEDTYKMEKYPYFGYMRGAYTKDEIREIVHFADMFGIEVIPCIQTLGHLAMTLRWPYANGMKDDAGILLIGEQKTYDFIEEMIKTCRECYKTDKIHVGMDEAHAVGLGNYLRKHGYQNRFSIMSEHLNRVMEISKKYGFDQPMMWSDMFFRLGSKDDNYYDLNAEMPENISEMIPEGLAMVYWDYYNMTSNFYAKMIEAHEAMKREVIFAGGIWTWNGLCINYDRSFITTRLALGECVKKGIKTAISTLWGDDGAECSIYTSLLGLQLYAEYCYTDTAEVSDEKLAEMFKICTGYDMDTFLLFGLDIFDESLSKSHEACAVKQVFYQDILMGLFDKNFAQVDLKSHYADFAEKLAKAPKQGELEYLFDQHRQLVKILESKCDIGIRLKAAYDAGDKQTMAAIADEIDVLLQNYLQYHKMTADIWYKNNKPFGFEVLDARLGGVETRVARAAARIRDYLNGSIDKMEELEEERLWYGQEGQVFVHDYSSQRIMHS